MLEGPPQAPPAREPWPQDPVALALRSVLTDDTIARRLGGLGLERAQAFHWRRTAEQTAAVYEHVLTNGRRR